MKHIWRISPYIAQGAYTGKRNTCWMLHKVTKGTGGGELKEPFGAYASIKAAKAMVKHLSRKPIEIG